MTKYLVVVAHDDAPYEIFYGRGCVTHDSCAAEIASHHFSSLAEVIAWLHAKGFEKSHARWSLANAIEKIDEIVHVFTLIGLNDRVYVRGMNQEETS